MKFFNYMYFYIKKFGMNCSVFIFEIIGKKWKGDNILLIILMKIFLKLRGCFFYFVLQEDIVVEFLVKVNLV